MSRERKNKTGKGGDGKYQRRKRSLVKNETME